MASQAEKEALLAVSCPWCGAKPKQECWARLGVERARPVTTLDGGAHDARWRAALNRPAAVITAAVASYQPERTEADEPVLVGAAIAERPW